MIIKRIMNEFEKINLLFQFMTRVPTFVTVKYSQEKLGKSIKYFPLIGLIIGTIVYLFSLLLLKLELKISIISLFLIFIDLFLVGIIHLDGLADSADALFSYKNKNDMLDIMKDSHIGTNGVGALIIYFLSKYILFEYILMINPVYFIVAYICSRLATSINASLSSYARTFDGGMSGSIFYYNGIKEFIFSLLLSFIILYIFIGWISIIYILFVSSFNFLLRKSIISKINGFTGDTLGFCLELTFITTLFLIILINLIYV